jgi:gamma-glutamylcyclotransferase (GGCT)/AIG2-like uncharacterized protein YtfP
LSSPHQDATLFVYGSLLDPTRRDEIIGRRVETAPATLRDYETGRARYFFVRNCRGARTTGLLLLNLTSRDFRRLDRYEETPRLYTREKIEVTDENGVDVRCWVYLPTAAVLSDNE